VSVDGGQPVDRGLALLRGLETDPSAWLDPSEIRRKGRNRRRRYRRTIGGSTVAVVVLAAALIWVSAGGQSRPSATTHVVAKAGPADTSCLT
jgi:hypothetical protein